MIEQPVGFMGERPQCGRPRWSSFKNTRSPASGWVGFAMNIKSPGPPDQYNVPYHAHNIYLHIATEHGIPSLLLFLWIVVIIAQQIVAGRRANDFWGKATFIGASGFLISAPCLRTRR